MISIPQYFHNFFIIKYQDNIQKKCIQRKCQSKEYFYKNTCSSNKPLNTFCDQSSMICEQCQNSTCGSCKQDLSACIKCMPNTYSYEDQCYESKPKSTYCMIENEIRYCQKCHEKCAECSGSSEKECKSCFPDSTLSNGACIISTLEYPSTFTAAKVEQIQEQVTTTSQTSNISSTVLSTSQNMISQSSFGLLIQGLTSQKLTYMVLVKTNIPSPVFAPLQSTSSQLPSHQMQSLNFLSSGTDQLNKYLNIKFEAIELRYSILDTCGQGISIFVICSIVFGMFYLATEKIAHTKINTYSKTLYEKVFSGFVIQYFQLLISMFSIGINTQILELINEDNIEQLPVKVVLVIFLSGVIVLIMRQLYFYLNFQTVQTNNLTFQEITREKILNETIFESKIRRNYMLILIFVESIIIPTIFIQFNFNSLISSILAIIFQFGFLILTCLLMPFHSKLTNAYFVINSFLWIALYINYLILNIYSMKSNVSEYSQILDRASWSFIVFIQLILLATPAYMALNLLVKLIDFIISKINQRKYNYENEILAQTQTFKQLEINNQTANQLKSISQELVSCSSSRELSSPTSYKTQFKKHTWMLKYK